MGKGITALTGFFRRIPKALNPTIIVRYDRKLISSVLLAMVAFVPALGIAAFSLSAIGNEQNRMMLLYRHQIVLGQHLKASMEAEDRLMPLFILTANPRFLDQLHQDERDLDAALAQLQALEAPGSHGAQLLNEIALLEHRRRDLAGPGVALRLQGQTIQNVNQYFEQNSGRATGDLHRGMDSFAQVLDTRFEDFADRERRRLHNIGFMLLTADAFALIVCIGVGVVVLRLLQAKRQHDADLVQQAEWERTLAIARKQAVETVAHDLRSPLQVMMYAAEKLQRVTTDRKSAQAALDGLARSATAMHRLIDTVLNPANIDAETLPLSKQPLDLHAVLHDLVSRFQLIATAGNINLTYAPTRDLPQLVADAARLEQVISNLLANAVKFTPTGGRITLAAAWADPWVTITVADTGRGMSYEQAENIFSRYWRGGTTPEHGSGLGLAISKAIVDAHDGRIEVNSTPDQGTAFVVFLPVPTNALQYAHNDHSRT